MKSMNTNGTNNFEQKKAFSNSNNWLFKLNRYVFPLIIGITLAVSIQAATYTVNDAGDTGDGTCDATCTLRDAILTANGMADDDIIKFASPLFDTAQTITLGGTELLIANNGMLTINGTGTDKLTVSGNNASRVFSINNGANADINGITISNGNGVGASTSTLGGGILNDGGILSLTHSAVNNNSGRVGSGIFNRDGSSLTITNSIINSNTLTVPTGGGGIFNNQSTLIINDSTICNNSGAGAGGGIANHNSSILVLSNSTVCNNSANNGGGGISNSDATLIVTNSTISNNSATIRGGGIDNEGGGISTITNSTIGNNSAGTGGGIINLSATSTLTLINTIVGNSNSGGDCVLSGGTINASYSLIEDGLAGCVNGTDSMNLSGDPLLAPLGNYGGPTQTQALLHGSPAIDTGDPNNFPQFDQRGNVRPADGNPVPLTKTTGKTRSALALLPDIGAFEALAPTAADASISGKVLSPTGRGVPRATVHVTDQNGDVHKARTNSFGYYRFEDIEVGQTLVFNVYSKQYQYDTQVINFEDALTKFNFFPQGGADRKSSDEKRE